MMPKRSTQRRSEITRHRVIDAAIQSFGMEGFERTSTRALVERAGTNLVSIHYHFGSKKAVYRAAARHIAAAISERNRLVIERARVVADRPEATRSELIECVCGLFDNYAAHVVTGGVPECWRQFLLREQLEPSGTGAFELIFAAIRPFFDTTFSVIGRLVDRPPTHAEVRLLAMMIFGQVSVFRTNRASALRLMGWRTLGARELAEVRQTARKYIFKLLAEPPNEAIIRPSRRSRPGKELNRTKEAAR